jgi:hypothetical protein
MEDNKIRHSSSGNSSFFWFHTPRRRSTREGFCPTPGAKSRQYRLTATHEPKAAQRLATTRWGEITPISPQLKKEKNLLGRKPPRTKLAGSCHRHGVALRTKSLQHKIARPQIVGVEVRTGNQNGDDFGTALVQLKPVFKTASLGARPKIADFWTKKSSSRQVPELGRAIPRTLLKIAYRRAER